MQDPGALRARLNQLHAEALRVGDSPLRADRLADQVSRVTESLPDAELSDDTRARLEAALADAERVLRRDDDGREAARHLQNALRLTAGDTPPRPSPFLDG